MHERKAAAAGVNWQLAPGKFLLRTSKGSVAA
jgi:hypothetical protein